MQRHDLYTIFRTPFNFESFYTEDNLKYLENTNTVYKIKYGDAYFVGQSKNNSGVMILIGKMLKFYTQNRTRKRES